MFIQGERGSETGGFWVGEKAMTVMGSGSLSVAREDENRETGPTWVKLSSEKEES